MLWKQIYEKLSLRGLSNDTMYLRSILSGSTNFQTDDQIVAGIEQLFTGHYDWNHQDPKIPKGQRGIPEG